MTHDQFHAALTAAGPTYESAVQSTIDTYGRAVMTDDRWLDDLAAGAAIQTGVPALGDTDAGRIVGRAVRELWGRSPSAPAAVDAAWAEAQYWWNLYPDEDTA